MVHFASQHRSLQRPRQRRAYCCCCGRVEALRNAVAQHDVVAARREQAAALIERALARADERRVQAVRRVAVRHWRAGRLDASHADARGTRVRLGNDRRQSEQHDERVRHRTVRLDQQRIPARLSRARLAQRSRQRLSAVRRIDIDIDNYRIDIDNNNE